MLSSKPRGKARIRSSMQTSRRGEGQWLLHVVSYGQEEEGEGRRQGP